MDLPFTFAITAIVLTVLAIKPWRPAELFRSPLSLFLVVSIAFVNIGFLVEYVQRGRPSWAALGIAATSLGVLCTAFAGLVARDFLSPPPHSAAPVATTEDFGFRNAAIVSIFIYAVVLLYFFLVGYIPLVEGIRTLLTSGFEPGLTNTYRIDRDVYVNPEATYIPLQGLLEATRYFGLPLTAIWFIHFRRAGIYPRIATGFIGTSAFLTILTGQRWPLLYFLCGIMVYLSITHERPRRFKKLLGRALLVSIFAGVLLSALLGRTLEDNLNPAQMVIFGSVDLGLRIVLGNVGAPFASFQLFPSTHPFLYGGSYIQNLISFLPGPSPSFPVTFYQIVTGDSTGFTGPPDFYTEAYINFGLIGVAIMSLTWGAFLSATGFWLTRTSHSLSVISVACLLFTVTAFSAISGITFVLGAIIVCVGALVLLRITAIITSISTSRSLESRSQNK